MLVLLDTNAYLRLAKRVRPAVGVVFGHKGYVLTIYKSVEDEVHRCARLKSLYPWFDGQEFAAERLAKQIRLSAEEKSSVQAAQSVVYGWVLADPSQYTSGGRSPPGPTDCLLLALVQVKGGIVVTDDLGMHALAMIVLVLCLSRRKFLNNLQQRPQTQMATRTVCPTGN